MIKGRVAEKQMEADCSLEREQPSITHPYNPEGCWGRIQGLMSHLSRGIVAVEAVGERTYLLWRLCSLSAPRGGCSHEAGR